MNLKSLLVMSANLLIASNLAAQTVKIIDDSQPGLLEATINADTNTDGSRKDPNAIYELKAGSIYVQNGPIIVNNSTGTLNIRGAAGGPKPVWLKRQAGGNAVGENKINSSLSFQNIQYEYKENTGELPTVAFNITGDNHTLRVEDCLIEHSSLAVFMADQVRNGAKIILRGNYFRDMNDFSQWWGARAVECKHAIDSLIVENNTFTGAGLLFLSQEALTNVAIINHNTIINNHKYPFLNTYWRECYITNNLFINANMVGEDIENVVSGGTDDDVELTGIFGIDTIERYIDMPLTLMNNDGTPGPMIDQLTDYIIYAADNVVTYSTTLDRYYNGTADRALNPSIPWSDAPASYLPWKGLTPPFRVVNVPGMWQNERVATLDADYENIKEEDNHAYEPGYTLEDIGMVTDPLPQDKADVFIQWNQAQWGVPGAVAPTAEERTVYYFGDDDPTTIPGVETEESATGITKISDLIEDFSYTKEMISESDGLKIGSLLWTDEAFDGKASLDLIKRKYAGLSVVKPIGSESGQYAYPNPVKSVLHVNVKNADITITTLDGRLVKSVKNQTGISVSDIAAGIYTVTIRDGKNVSTQKVLISR